ncbi:halo-CC-star protein HcsS [Natronorubrum sp. A-ect3]|uniref:halo-CC-star protein HcsS n=1 Tax=Natronorubrum sp. A-ect3 TaxID=3242698 RepID=UPI00359D24FB
MLLTTNAETLTAAEQLGDALVAAKEESADEEYTSLLLECNEELKHGLGIDYGAICSDDDCC